MTTNPPGSNPQGSTGAKSTKSTKDTMRDDVQKTVGHAREGAAGRVEGIAGSIDAAASHLDQEDMTRLSGYVHDMADSLSRFAGELRDKNGDDMLHDVSDLARRNPALFLGGSVALGFGMSRFARSSQSRREEQQLPVSYEQPGTSLGTGTSTRSSMGTGAGASSGSSPGLGTSTPGSSTTGTNTLGATTGGTASGTRAYSNPSAKTGDL